MHRRQRNGQASRNNQASNYATGRVQKEREVVASKSFARCVPK